MKKKTIRKKTTKSRASKTKKDDKQCEELNFAPRQDYRQFEAAVEPSRLEVNRRASPIQKAKRFAELCDIAGRVEKPNSSPKIRVDRWLAEKIPIRIRQIESFGA